MRFSLIAVLPTFAIAACSGSGNEGTTAVGGFSSNSSTFGQGGVVGLGGNIAVGGTTPVITTRSDGSVGGTLSTSGNNVGGKSASSSINVGSTHTGGTANLSGGASTGGRSNSGGNGIGGTANLSGGASTGGRSNSGGNGIGGAAVGGATNASNIDPFVPGTAPTAAKFFKKGINLGNRLEAPNEGDWGSKILDTDLAFIASRGFDHVRVPIRFSGHALAVTPYTIDATFFSRVDTILDQAAQAKLGVVIDLHAYDDLNTNASGHRDRFLALWSQIATRYRSRPENVAFELLNEPYSQLDTAWNNLAEAAVQVVRATNPRRLLVVDAVYWADPSRLSQLSLPNDANIMVAIHLYEPKLFSFQGKSWMGPEFMTTGITFPGPPVTPVTPVAAATAASWAKSWFDGYNTKPAATNPSGPATVAAQMAYITSYRSSSGRTVYNGEWGPQDGGEMESRARLVTLVRQECEKAGVGWAIWEDPQNMKLFDSVAKTWVTTIVDALLPR